MTTEPTTQSADHPVYPGGPPCNPYCEGRWSAYHDGYGDGYDRANREARAALLDDLEAAVRGMDATCHDGEGLRCEHVEDWPGVPGAPFDDGCNTDVSRASVLRLIQQHREGNP